MLNRFGFSSFRLPGDVNPLRVPWLRLLQYIGVFMAVAGLIGGCGSVILFSLCQIDWIRALIGLAFFSVFSGLLLFVICAFLDLCWLEYCIHRRFRWTAARIHLRELIERTGTQPYAVRLAAEVEDGNGPRIVQVVPGFSDAWRNAKERERFLNSHIRPDGTCEVALDPLHPEQAYLLPRFDTTVWGGLVVLLVIAGWLWWQTAHHVSPALPFTDSPFIERPR